MPLKAKFHWAKCRVWVEKWKQEWVHRNNTLLTIPNHRIKTKHKKSKQNPPGASLNILSIISLIWSTFVAPTPSYQMKQTRSPSVPNGDQNTGRTWLMVPDWSLDGQSEQKFGLFSCHRRKGGRKMRAGNADIAQLRMHMNTNDDKSMSPSDGDQRSVLAVWHVLDVNATHLSAPVSDSGFHKRHN